MCACVRDARVALACWIALVGGMAGWVGWLAGCVVAMLARRLRAELVDWLVGRRAQLTHYLSDGRGSRPTWRRRQNKATVSQSKVRRRCARTFARTNVSAMIPQRVAVVWNPLPNLISLSTPTNITKFGVSLALRFVRCVVLRCVVV